MGFRFYRRLRLAPGFTLNLSKRGASLSVGRRGMHVTVGTHGTRETVGIPGTGISYTAVQGHRRRRAAQRGSILSTLLGLFLLYLIIRVCLGLAGIIGPQQSASEVVPHVTGDAPAAAATHADAPVVPRKHYDPGGISMCPAPRHMTRDGCQ